MTDQVTLTIDGQEITVPEGTTILEAAAQLGIHIPVICYHPHLSANGLCRVCSVDTGGRVQAAACITPCSQNMQVQTDNESVQRGRKTMLEMLASAVDLSESPGIQDLMSRYQADSARFANGEKRQSPVYDDNPFYIRDYNKCIDCWRCVQVCAEDAQYTFALSFDGRGFETRIGTFMGHGMMDTTCVFCGQCVGVCPTGALKPKRQALLEQGMDPNEIFFQTKGSGKKKMKSG
jgi:predicted molibdopterin-dependent oxidoreductase YjgC